MAHGTGPACSAAGIDELVLDWNGTVVDDAARALRSTNLVAAHHRLPTLDMDEFRDRFRLPLHAFLRALGIHDDELTAAEEHWNSRMREAEAPLSPGATNVLEECYTRQIPVGIITGADATVVDADAQRSGVRDLLTWVVGPSSDKRSDLRKTRNQHGTRIAFVGDTTHDIEHSKEAGVLSVAYTGGYTPADVLRATSPDLVIDDLTELIPLLADHGSGPTSPTGPVQPNLSPDHSAVPPLKGLTDPDPVCKRH